MTQLLGRAIFRVDGEDLASYPGATLNPGGIARTARAGHRLHGFSERTEPASLECKVNFGEGFNLKKIRGWKDVTILFEPDIGPSLVIREAFLTEPPTITDGDDSGVDLNFSGQPAEEV